MKIMNLNGLMVLVLTSPIGIRGNLTMLRLDQRGAIAKAVLQWDGDIPKTGNSNGMIFLVIIGYHCTSANEVK